MEHGGVLIRDSNGNKIAIGDRVRVLWNFDNKIYSGDIVSIRGNIIEVDIVKRRISTANWKTIEKVPSSKTGMEIT